MLPQKIIVLRHKMGSKLQMLRAKILWRIQKQSVTWKLLMKIMVQIKLAFQIILEIVARLQMLKIGKNNTENPKTIDNMVAPNENGMSDDPDEIGIYV